MEIINGYIEEAAKKLGYTIYESSVQLRGSKSKISVKIDNGAIVSHDDCAAYSRELKTLLDAREDILPDYLLEVSSPGVKRRLTSKEDYIRFTGSPVKVVYRDGEVIMTAKGKLLLVGDDSIVVKEEKAETTVLYSSIKSSNLDY